MRDMKQETLAEALGISRQSVSKIEQSEEIEDDKLEQIAKALGVTVDAIKNFNEEATINYNQFNYEGSNKEAGSVWVHNHNCTFNPMEKIVELYERMLQLEREKNVMLQNYIDEKRQSA